MADPTYYKQYRLSIPPQDTHENWYNKNYVIPDKLVCYTLNRQYDGSVEYFIGDGRSNYRQLLANGKVFTSNVDMLRILPELPTDASPTKLYTLMNDGTGVNWVFNELGALASGNSMMPKPNASSAQVGTSAYAARADHVHPNNFNLNGNANSASKFNSNKTITLNGFITGSVTSNFNSNTITLTTYVDPDVWATKLDAEHLSDAEHPHVKLSSNVFPTKIGTASAVGTSQFSARADHVHQSIIPFAGPTTAGKILRSNGSNTGDSFVWDTFQVDVDSVVPAASKLKDPITINLGGVLTGSVSFTGNEGSETLTATFTESAFTALSDQFAPKSHGTHVTYGTSAPKKASGSGSAGSANSVSRSDHVHPTEFPSIDSGVNGYLISNNGSSIVWKSPRDTMNSAVATTSAAGAVVLATGGEVTTGTDATKVITPSTLNYAFKTSTEGYYKFSDFNAADGTYSLDCSKGNVLAFKIANNVTVNITNFNKSNTSIASTTARVVTLIITNGGNYTWAFNKTIKWADGSSPLYTRNGVDIITLFSPDNGTTLYGFINGKNFR